jgi:hypothetical protein
VDEKIPEEGQIAEIAMLSLVHYVVKGRKGKKVKLSLCLIKHHAMKAYFEWKYSSTHSWTSALGGGKWSASLPGRFTPRETAPGTHSIGGKLGPRAGLDAVAKGKIPSPCRNANPRSSSP